MIEQKCKSDILIVGSGGREHALGWKLRQSSVINRLYFAPGNGGTSRLGQNLDIGTEETNKLVGWASDNQIDFTVVGPEASLAAGIVDEFNEAFIPIFGPTQKAAQLETSKNFAADFMNRHGIPHPGSYTFTSFELACQFIAQKPWKDIVIKADGLAAGKGVELPESDDEAITVLDAFMRQGLHKEAGKQILIQERLFGPEVSILAFSDGKTVIPLLPAQDHKKLLNGDLGPNTGSMGAIAPVKEISPELLTEITTTILKPTIDGMREEGTPYKGVLYAGLMLTKDGPKVLEFNARFGDPETQPLMMLLDADLATILFCCYNKMLKRIEVPFRKGAAVCVVLAADGYPGKYQKGTVIEGLDRITDPNVVVFHAGTIMKDGKLVTNGGRVSGVTAYGSTLAEALSRAYGAIGPDKGVYFYGMQYRTDIGKGQFI